MPKQTTETKTTTDPLDDAFVFLKGVPDLPQYKKMGALEAYALHADYLIERAKESEAAAIPKGSHAEKRHGDAAVRTRLRSRLCSLVAEGQSIQAAIQAVFHDATTKQKTDNNATETTTESDETWITCADCGNKRAFSTVAGVDSFVCRFCFSTKPLTEKSKNPTSRQTKKSASVSAQKSSTGNSSVIPITSKRRSSTSNTATKTTTQRASR